MEGVPKLHLHGSPNEASMMSLVLSLCLRKVQKFRLTQKWGAMASAAPRFLPPGEDNPRFHVVQ